MINREVYLHIGLPKTGSTYFQKNIFPFFEDTDFFMSSQSFSEIVWQAIKKKLFISHESFSGAPVRTVRLGPKGWLKSRDQRLGFLSSIFPYANIIIFFRSHGEWISSMYRQYLHQGGILKFDDFFSINEDLIVERAGLYYESIFRDVRDKFNGKILCVNYEGFKKNSNKIYDMLEDFIGARLSHIGKSEIVHPSVKRFQAQVLRYVNYVIEPSYLEYRRLPHFKRVNGIFWRMGLTPDHVIRRMGFLGKIGKDVVSNSKIAEINEFYRADWEWVQRNVGEYAAVI